MYLTSETQLVLVIFALYLYECTVLLYAGEAVLERAGSRWHVRFGSEHAQLRGRRPVLLNPLLPWRASFRASWETNGAEAVRDRAALASGMIALRQSLAKLRPFVGVVWLLLLLVIPALLLMTHMVGFLAAVAAAYFAIVAMLVRLWFLRPRLALTRGKFGMLAFECLACPPCAANLVRKLSLASPLRADLVTAVEAAASTNTEEAYRRIAANVEAALTLEEPASSRYARLRAVHERLQALLAQERSS